MMFQKEAASFSCNLIVRVLFFKTVIALYMAEVVFMSVLTSAHRVLKSIPKSWTFSKIKSILLQGHS